VSGTVDAAYRIFADPLLLAGKAKRLYDVKKYALEVVTGKSGNLTEYFSKQGTIDFWNIYGEKLQALEKAQTAKNPEAIIAARQELKPLRLNLVQQLLNHFNLHQHQCETQQLLKYFLKILSN